MKNLITIMACVFVLACGSTQTGSTVDLDVCPGVDDESLKIRKKAIGKCSDEQVFLYVAKTDEKISVRAKAAKKISDRKHIEDLLGHYESDDSMSRTKGKRLIEYLQAKISTLERCPGVCQKSTKAREEAIRTCSDDDALVFVAKYDFKKHLRLMALDQIARTNSLDGLEAYFKKDRTLTKKKKQVFIAQVKNRMKILVGAWNKYLQDKGPPPAYLIHPA